MNRFLFLIAMSVVTSVMIGAVFLAQKASTAGASDALFAALYANAVVHIILIWKSLPAVFEAKSTGGHNAI